MRVRPMDAAPGARQRRRTAAQFGLQVTPLVKQLALGLLHARATAAARDLATVKPVPAPMPFIRQNGQKRGHGRLGVRMRAEPLKLRMVPVATGSSRQHLARQQRFAPGGDEAFGIQVFRVERPESHGEAFNGPSPLDQKRLDFSEREI